MNKRLKVIILAYFALIMTAYGLSATFEFNTCGSDGRTGPSSCSYGGDNSVTINKDGYQRWTVPATGNYEFEVAGAQGGAYGGTSGKGAIADASFDLSEGETIVIVVGQKGQGDPDISENIYDTGGGGGTFVWKAGASSPLIVAGGGAGYIYENTDTSVKDASTGECGYDSSADGGGNGDQDTHYNGGCSGDGGEGGGTYHGGGGGGWLSSGSGYNGNGGSSIRDGDAVGGSGETDNQPGGYGGFGGGGGGWREGSGGDQGPGGGGGYSGGAGASDESAGGGGSYIDSAATSTSITTGNEGHGYVNVNSCEIYNFNDPSIQSPSYSDSEASSSSAASFDTSVSVSVDSEASDDCGNTKSGNSLSSCSVTATGEEGGSYSPSASVSGDTCEFSVDNDGVSAWGPGEQVTLDITVTDDEGGTDTLTDTYTFVDTDVNEISVTSPSDNADGVFGFDSGVDLEFSVTDYEAKTTNKDLSVDILGDSLQNIGTQTVSNGDGSVSIEWERDGEFGDTGMYGFKRGNSYSWNVDVAYASDGTDIGGNSGDPWSFTVEQPPNINGLTPTDGAQSSGLSVQELQNTISVNQMEVEFYLGSLGTSSYNIEGTDTVLGSSGAASTNIMDAVQSGDEYEWWIGVDDGHSYIKYDSRVNTFTAPEVLRSATDLYVLPTERPSRDKLNNLESGDESYIWVDNGKLHWVDPATGTERWLQFAQSLSETTIPSGAIWVDGENLVWVGEDTTRYQHVGTNDGSSSLDPGTFWVDSSGYLRYVDGNGNERVMNG